MVLIALRASCPSGTGVAALVTRALPLATELLPLTGLLKEEGLYYYPALRAPLLKEGELGSLVPFAFCLLPVA